MFPAKKKGKKKDCVTLTQRFFNLCFDPGILQLCSFDRPDIINGPVDNSTQRFGKATYRQFILDMYGYLGRGNGKVVQSCSVWNVCGRYPCPTGVYIGVRDREHKPLPGLFKYKIDYFALQTIPNPIPLPYIFLSTS